MLTRPARPPPTPQGPPKPAPGARGRCRVSRNSGTFPGPSQPPIPQSAAGPARPGGFGTASRQRRRWRLSPQPSPAAVGVGGEGASPLAVRRGTRDPRGRAEGGGRPHLWKTFHRKEGSGSAAPPPPPLGL